MRGWLPIFPILSIVTRNQPPPNLMSLRPITERVCSLTPPAEQERLRSEMALRFDHEEFTAYPSPPKSIQ
jgi:hypothetical protein